MAKRRPGSPDAARTVALDVMGAVRDRDAFGNLVLPALLRERGLSGRDAAFATELAYGAIRMQGCYDAVLGAVVLRSLSELEPGVLDVLRLGCHQLLSLHTPNHAAVSTSVDLVRARVGARAVSVVNAVLRRVSADDMAGWLAEVAPAVADDPYGHLAVVHSHPRWIVTAFAATLGGDLDETARLLAADNVPPAVTLVARPGLAERAELMVDGALAGALSPYAVRLAGGDPGALPAIQEGRAGVQDEGSQMVTLAFADAPLEGSDTTWLDLCAGPGGKAALLAAVGAPRGAWLLAHDRAPHRARLVAAALRQLTNTAVVVGDGRRPSWPVGSFDRVLVDAPCSGLGALRRRPEARWRRSAAELPGLVMLQRGLLGAAIDSVRPGGIVGYATCSPLLDETREVVGAVTQQRSDVTLLDAPALCSGIVGQRSPYLQLWPQIHGTDAMFLALLRRN